MVFQDLSVACTLSLVYAKMFLDDDYLALRGLVTWMAWKELVLESWNIWLLYRPLTIPFYRPNPYDMS